MSTIVEIPGIGEVEFPDSMNEQEISGAIQSMKPGQILPQTEARPMPADLRQELIPGIPGATLSGVGKGPSSDAREAGLRAAGSQFLGNIAEIPNLALTAAANIPSVRSMLPPDDVMRVPKIGERVLPTPSGEQIIAGAETALQSVPAALSNLGAQAAAARTGDEPPSGVNLSQMFGQNLADAEALAQEHPLATGVGESLGDAATLLTGRAPISRLSAPAKAARRKAIEGEIKKRLDLIPESLKDELSDVVTRKGGEFFKESGRLGSRAGAKAIGTGLEGASLALLDDGDPEAMFWFGAGGQAAGSAALWMVEKPIKRLAPFVATSFLAAEMFKAAAPGEQSFFESKDFAIRKANWSLALGLTASMAGAGRLRGAHAEKFPVLFDGITSVPRGVLLSRLKELSSNAEQGNELPLKVMERFATNPSAFNTNQQNALGRAVNSEKPGAFTKEVERLMRDSADFRERMSVD